MKERKKERQKKRKREREREKIFLANKHQKDKKKFFQIVKMVVVKI